MSCIQRYDRSPAWVVLISGPGNQVSASVQAWPSFRQAPIDPDKITVKSGA